MEREREGGKSQRKWPIPTAQDYDDCIRLKGDKQTDKSRLVPFRNEDMDRRMKTVRKREKPQPKCIHKKKKII